MVKYTVYMLSTQPDPLPPRYTLYKYNPVLIHTGKGGGGK
jgi:hypothetical protein